MWVPGAVLTAPALFLAGLAASPHCSLMCGALAVHQARAAGSGQPHSLALLHTGRVLGYAALGGLAGATGQGLLHQLPAPALGRVLQAAAALGLLWVGARMALARQPALACCGVPAPHALQRWPQAAQALARGLLWAALPCGLLYSVLLLAAFAGDAGRGALLTGAFALGGTPLLGLIGWGGARRRLPARHLRTAGWGLMGLGTAGLAALAWLHSPLPAWCG